MKVQLSLESCLLAIVSTPVAAQLPKCRPLSQTSVSQITSPQSSTTTLSTSSTASSTTALSATSTSTSTTDIPSIVTTTTPTTATASNTSISTSTSTTISSTTSRNTNTTTSTTATTPTTGAPSITTMTTTTATTTDTTNTTSTTTTNDITSTTNIINVPAPTTTSSTTSAALQTVTFTAVSSDSNFDGKKVVNLNDGNDGDIVVIGDLFAGYPIVPFSIDPDTGIVRMGVTNLCASTVYTPPGAVLQSCRNPEEGIPYVACLPFATGLPAQCSVTYAGVTYNQFYTRSSVEIPTAGYIYLLSEPQTDYNPITLIAGTA